MTESRIFTVKGIPDSQCKFEMERALGTLNGVEKATVNLVSKRVAVNYDNEKITRELIVEVIEDHGFEVV